MQKLLVLNGPNLNMLGLRQPEIYGSLSLADIEAMCVAHGRTRGFDIETQQSNHEGALIDALHSARTTVSGVAFNAGAYTHTSAALHDAILAAEVPVVEVHMSNIHAREAFRHHSMIAPVVIGQVAGFGAQSYILALDALIAHLEART